MYIKQIGQIENVLIAEGCFCFVSDEHTRMKYRAKYLSPHFLYWYSTLVLSMCSVLHVCVCVRINQKLAL